MANVFAEQAFIESIVSCWDWSMSGEQTGSPHYFQSLLEIQLIGLNIFTQSLQASKCGVTFIAMIHSRIEAQVSEGPHSAYAKQQFLFKPILPISSIEVIGYLPVFRDICLIIRIHKIEIRTAYSHLP